MRVWQGTGPVSGAPPPPPPLENEYHPWCPNCRRPLELADIGSLTAPAGAGVRVIYCRKCGIILGGSSA